VPRDVGAQGMRLEQANAMKPRRLGEVRAHRSFWTWQLGQVKGIAIRVHLSLILLLAWLAVVYATHGAGIRGTALGIALVASVFTVILVHELAHALVARMYGVPTRDILLLPIGGIASLERMPDKPRQELAVALVGPAVNVAIAALLYAGITLIGSSAFAAQLMWINIGLALFNLIPAFPMDGGRVLRSLLAMRLGDVRATQIAARLGRGLAVLFGLYGLFYNPLLVVIAMVVWAGATQEGALAQLKSTLEGVPVSAAMLRRIETVEPGQPLEDAAALLLHGSQHELPIIEHGQPVGVLTRSDIATALAHSGPNATVGEAPHHVAVTVSPSDPLDLVLDRLRQTPDAVAVVLDHGIPVGLLDAEHLASYVALHERRAA
jgi:Zn-dependent protease/CBS domain-containing protein